MVGFQPQNIREFCQAYCAKCKEAYSFSQIGTSTQCKNNCMTVVQPVFKVVLYLKDEQSHHIDEIFKLHYYTPVGNQNRTDARLFNIQPCNLYSDEESLQKVMQYLNLLSQFNVYMDLLIEGGYYPHAMQNLFTLLEGQLIDL